MLAGPFGKGKNADVPVSSSIQRHLTSQLGLLLKAGRQVQGDDEVSFTLPSTEQMPGGKGFLHVPSFTEDPAHDQLEILDLSETSVAHGGSGSRRWGGVRTSVEGRADAGAKGATSSGSSVLFHCKSAVAIGAAEQLCITLARRSSKAARVVPDSAGCPCLPAVLLLHGEGMKGGHAGKKSGGEEDEATWPEVRGTMGGKAWFTKAELLVKITRHQAFVNSLTSLLGQTAALPTRVFTADARGVIRAWTILADDKGSVAVSHLKSFDLVTLQSAEQAVGDKVKLPAIKGQSGDKDKENQETQKQLHALHAKERKQEHHGTRSVVCIRAHDAGESSRLAVMSVDSLIRVLDAQTLRLVYTLSGSLVRGPNACMKCAWSADGRLLAAGSEDGRLLVWKLPPSGSASSSSALLSAASDVSAPQSMSVIQPGYQSKGQCTGVCFSPYTRDLVTCCLGVPSPIVVANYLASSGSLSLEKACDLVADALDGNWGLLVDSTSASGSTMLSLESLRSFVMNARRGSGASGVDEVEAALAMVFDFLAAASGAGAGGVAADADKFRGLGSPVKGAGRGGGGVGGKGLVHLESFVKSLAPKQWAAIKTDGVEKRARNLAQSQGGGGGGGKRAKAGSKAGKAALDMFG